MSTADDQRILSASAVMAAGTIVSRLSGFVRTALLAAALGPVLHADVFNIANTIPNMLYILLAGGIVNAVLVPQLVRAMKHDADAGEAYTNRVITLAALFLAVVTVLLVVAAPWVMRLVMDPAYFTPELTAQRESVIAFARYCLPQVFFYGMFVLVGQILNARGRFGPMMWAPIANNVIAIGVLTAYLLVYGKAEDLCGGYTRSQELLLGVGSTVGIAAQLAILVPYLRAAGVTYRPRFDFRDAGLGHTLRLGYWTVLFVIVNQVAYTIVVRLASSGTAQPDACGLASGTGYSIYSSAFLILMVPHSVVTVSLATAILPRLSAHAAEADLPALAGTLATALRTALAVVVPFAALLPVVAPDLADFVWGHGATGSRFWLFVPTLSLFGPGLVFFTVHYLMLRGFYALERTRTVFAIQCVIAATNIAVAVLLVRSTGPESTSPALVAAYVASYLLGAVLSYAVLRRLLGGLGTRELGRYLVRLAVAVGVTTMSTLLLTRLLHGVAGRTPNPWLAAGLLALETAMAGVVYLGMARLLRLREVAAITNTLTQRLPRRLRGR